MTEFGLLQSKGIIAFTDGVKPFKIQVLCQG